MSTDTGTEPPIEEQQLLLFFRRLNPDWQRTVLGIVQACFDLQRNDPDMTPRRRKKEIH